MRIIISSIIVINIRTLSDRYIRTKTKYRILTYRINDVNKFVSIFRDMASVVLHSIIVILER